MRIRFAMVGSNVSGLEPAGRRLAQSTLSPAMRSRRKRCGSMLTVTTGRSDFLSEQPATTTEATISIMSVANLKNVFIVSYYMNTKLRLFEEN